MKKSKKKWIIASYVCVLIGGFIVFGAAAAVDFDFTAFNSEKTYDKTYAVSEGFENINIEIERTEASENIKINSTSGAVSLLSCDSEYIEIKTTSGNVSGYLMSEKDFTVNTSSGDIDLPDGSSSRQKCIVSTSSGDIRFRIKEN